MYSPSAKAKLTAEIAELEKQVEERGSKRSALASSDGDVSTSAISALEPRNIILHWFPSLQVLPERLQRLPRLSASSVLLC